MSTTPAHVDVLIVGAGLVRYSAPPACLQTDAPGVSYAIVDGRCASGGTWDLFRFPGVRSDSDMFTLGYAFRPWTVAEVDRRRRGDPALPAGNRGRLRHRPAHHLSLPGPPEREWSSPDARWTVTLDQAGDRRAFQRTCGFLYLCSGYYRYDEGYTPDWQGRENSPAPCASAALARGPGCHGKRVVVIGSGATAVTLVPALAEKRRARHHAAALTVVLVAAHPRPSGRPAGQVLPRGGRTGHPRQEHRGSPRSSTAAAAGPAAARSLCSRCARQPPERR